MKEYIIIYRSEEHYEVLGWVKAVSVKDAVKKAGKELKKDILRYGVADASIAEWRGAGPVAFTDEL
jgi:hypothetical protein